MRQRVMIAMALACNPPVLIADEPTTALDVTTQAEILDLIKRLQQSHGMAVLFITHDMGVVAEIADEVLVMYRGKVMEHGPVEQIFHAPQDDYTRRPDRLRRQAGEEGGDSPDAAGNPCRDAAAARREEPVADLPVRPQGRR